MVCMREGWDRPHRTRMRARLGWSRLAALAGAIGVARARRRGAEATRRRVAPPRAPARHRALRGLRHARRSTRATSPSRRSIRSGPTARPSGAGSRCRPAPRSTPPTPTPGCSRSAPGSGRSSPSPAGGSRPAIIERLRRRAWRYAAYEWSADGRDGDARARAGPARRLPVRRAGGRTRSRASATAGSATRRRRTPVLGFSLLQLSPDRDPGALHAEPGRRRRRPRRSRRRRACSSGCRPTLLETPPRIAAATPDRAGGARLPARQLRALPQRRRQARASSGSSCATSPAAPVEPAVATTVGSPVDDPAPGPDARTRCCGSTPGDPERSALAQRMGSRWAALQMPPLGTELVDERGARPDPANGSPIWTASTPRAKKRGSEDDDTSHRTDVLGGGRAAAGRAGLRARAQRPGGGRQVPGRHLRVPRLPHPLASWGRTDRSRT